MVEQSTTGMTLETLAEIASNLRKSMKGDANADLPEQERLQDRVV
jgi:pyridoxal 5'-phosphate synthase pdxS subunit